MEVERIDNLRQRLQESFDILVKKIDVVKIGNKKQFPFGWRKAAKGRTVWRILEELITQNLEKYHKELNIESIKVSDSEVSVHDFECKFADIPEPLYINIKSAVKDGKKNKDDLSKAEGLTKFYKEDANRNLFIGSFIIDFQDDMIIKICESVVFPIAWIPDVYINPSNNGNLQSSEYKYIDKATKRTNEEFIRILNEEIEVANNKRRRKMKKTEEEKKIPKA